MDERLKNIAAGLLARWKSLEKKQKVLLIGGLVGVVALAIIISVVVNTVTYEALFSGLSDSESGQIVSQLKTMGVSYRTSGDTIYVDKTKADEVRMQLAVDGYPNSDLNYSLYQSSTGWAQTDSDKKTIVKYQLQNRLQDTIRTITGVKSAVVTIGNSDSNDYVLSTDKVPVTASVKLNLNPGVSLTQKQVKGIVMLVSRSYPDLSADNVSVIDSDGTPLTNGDSSTGDSSDQLQLQAQIESMIRAKVLEVLNPVYGSGNIQVAAGATLDFTDTTTNSTTYSGTNDGKGVVSGEQTSSSATTNGGGAAGGTTGVNGGTPTYATTSSGANSTSTQQSSQTNYLVNSVNKVVQSHGGSVSKLTVAVLLNTKDKVAATARAASVQETVAFAVGIDPKDISVQMTPFASPQSTGTSSTGTSVFNDMFLIAGAAALLLIIAITILVTMLLVRKSHKKAAKIAAEQAAEETPAVGKAPSTTAFDLPSLEETMQNSQQNGYKKQIESLVDKKPELVAQILKNWLKD